MGVADRDWYRDELRKREGGSRSPEMRFRPPASSHQPLAFATWVVVIGAIVAVMYGADRWKAKAKRLTPSVSQPVHANAPRAEPTYSPAPATPDFRQPQTETVAKCVVDGQTTYSSGNGCTGLNTSLSLVGKGSEIEGGFSKYQLQMLRSADARIARSQWQQPAGPGALASITSLPSGCALFQEQLRLLDLQARHAHSAFAQDALRHERMAITSRQFASEC